MRIQFLILPLLLAACGDKEAADDTASDTDTDVEDLDQDDDGFDAADDCDDEDSSVNPDAEEVCDGVDNNCDGVVDDDATDATIWYLDADEDGYGNATEMVASCEQPDGYVAGDTDCDDAEAAAYPGADEICDGIDNDCNGDVDDSDETVLWYADDDGDGYGDPEVAVDACEPPEGFVADNTDCDDLSSATYPDADEYCDGVDTDCDGDLDEADAIDASTWYADSDEDSYGDALTVEVACDQPSGFVADDQDCDDAATDVNPDAIEVCDEVDNNCDGDVDEDSAADAPTWYADKDADSYGDVDNTTVSCSQPSGFVADATDCDDGETAVNPGAAEVCDEVDNNCDGDVDEDTAIDAATWYADSDSDSYGDAAVSSVSCDQPTGYVADNTDCDDNEELSNPGETEVCDELDNNCDGDVDEDTASDAATWYADSDSDSYGDASSTDVSCAQPSGYVADNTDCDDNNTDINPAADEVCDGDDNDCDGNADESDAIDAGTWYDDADSDGYGDASTAVTSCAQPTGTVSDGTDCDDDEVEANPGETEVCDEIDNDCDGDVDDDDSSLDTSTASTWYQDADEDGYGVSDSSTLACVQPTAYADNTDDCDDDDEDINPAGVEIPQDGIDQDCDEVDAPYAVTDLAVGDLVITEIIQDPAKVTDAYGEWFEVLNDSGGTVDLDGLYVYDLGSDKFTVSGELLVADGGYVVFGINDDTSLNGGAPVDYDYNGMSLGNGSDEIYLAESSSKVTVFDGVEWDNGATFPDSAGISMSLGLDYLDASSNDNGLNWCEASSSYGDGDYGTPGAENDECVVVTSAFGDGASASGSYGDHGVNYMLGQEVTLSSAITLTAFGIDMYSGGTTVQLALYTDSSGAPGTLVAETVLTSVSTGDNELSVSGGSVSVAAGDYWIVEIPGTSPWIQVVEDSSTSATTWYRSYTAGIGFPSTGGSGATYTDTTFASWLVGY